jgi:hypothetical protein
MAVYRGVVKGNTVVLSGPVDLPDGAEVEVWPVAPARTPEEEQTQEDAFEQHLLAIGLLKRLPAYAPDPPGLDRTPAELEGTPLSERLIQDRR